MMGDRLLEQIMIMNMKQWFTMPLRYESPIEQSHWLARNLADWTDRHSALFMNNTHPLQLFTYKHYNQFLADMHCEQKTAEFQEDEARLKELQEAKEAEMD
jgi:hypothetical protein